MAINFPSSPTIGQVYEYQSIRWRWNGSAWDKYEVFTFNGLTANVEGVSRFNGLTGPVGISAGQLIDITLTGSTFTISSPDTLYGISGNIYASNLATGLLYGGILSINAGNTAHFDITGGKGQIHASGSGFTSGPFPLFNYVTWPGQTGITLTYLATHDTTWIYIDETGVLHQRTEYYTDEQLEENIIIGQLLHPSRTYINLARTNPNVAYATDKQYEQFIRAFGPIKVSGHTITPNGANLKLNRSSGKAFSLGRNWINDTDNPSVVSDSAQTDCIFYRYYRGATAGTFITVPNQTVIDPGKYDDGSGTLQAAPGGKYSIQRLFYYPNTPTLLGVYYGRALYNSLADAAANINLEQFTEIENTRTNAIFAGYLIVRAGTTNLSNSSDALILQSGSFRSTTSGGGSVSLTLDDLTDVIITSPQDLQVLAYVDGVTGWENKSVSTLPLVYSFNGLTGAVTGVASFNGSTGTVVFSNYVSTFNGLTGAVTGVTSTVAGTGISITGTTRPTITNTGVQIFNGLTGAVIGVTQINAGTGIAITGTTNPTVTNTGVLSFNGSTGAVSGVNSVNGLTGTLTISGGTGMSVLSGGKGITLVNTGVLSIDGSTGAITNVARTNTTNTFTSLQTFNLGITAAGATFTNNVVIPNHNIRSLTMNSYYYAPYAGLATYGTLGINCDETGNGGAQTITYIGDVGAENNNTSITVNDTSGTITVIGNNLIDTYGALQNNTSIKSPIFIDTYSNIKTLQTTTTATTTNQTIATIEYVYDPFEVPSIIIPAFEVTISAHDTVLNKAEMLKMHIVQNGTDTVNTQYGLIRTGVTGPVSSYTTTLTGSPSKDLLIRATPSSTNSTKFSVTVRAYNG